MNKNALVTGGPYLQRSPRPPNWILGRGRESTGNGSVGKGKGRGKEGRVREGN